MERDGATALAGCWRWWADAVERLDDRGWAAPTRCEGWDVAALVNHATPDVGALQALAPVPGGAGLGDGADLLRLLNQPGGLAHQAAPHIAEAAVAAAATSDRRDVVARFRDAADVIASTPLQPDDVVAHPAAAVTVAALTEVAVMEAVVHGLDLVAAVGGAPPPPAAIALARDVLARVPDPTTFVEAAAGRTPATSALPAIR